MSRLEYIEKDDVVRALFWIIPLFLLYIYTLGIVAGLFSKYFEAYKSPLFFFNALMSDLDVPWHLVFFVNTMPYLILSLLFYEHHRLRTLHGDAHFASEREIKRAGLRAERGIIVGKKNGKYLVVGGNEHILAYCPPGSGKSTGLTIPNLLNWPDSCVVLDVKKDAFKKTSGFRKKHGQKVFLWAPSDKDGETARFNPLSYISDSKLTRIDDVQKVASTLLPSENDKGEIWQPEARTILVGIVLHLIDRNGKTNFGEVLRFIRGTADLKNKLQALIAEYGLDPVSERAFNSFSQKATKEASGVSTTLLSALELFENPIIDAATSETDFDIRKLRKEKMTIYVGVGPGDVSRLAPILNMFFQQIVRELTVKEPDEDEPYQVMCLLDEFTSLGKVPVIESSVAYLRGYHIRLFFIIQGVSQLEGVYSRPSAKTFMQNCKIKYVSAQNDLDTAKEVSGMLGFRTVRSVSKSTPISSFNSAGGGGGSMSVSHSKKELMQPHEVMQLRDSQTLLLVEANPPIKAKKIAYYKDKEMIRRSEYEPAYVPRLDLEAFYTSITDEYKKAKIEDDAIQAQAEEEENKANRSRTGSRKATGRKGKNTSSGKTKDDFGGAGEIIPYTEYELDAAMDELM